MPERRKIRGTNDFAEIGDDGSITVIPSDKTVNVSGYDTRPTPSREQQSQMVAGDTGRRISERIAAALPAVAGAVAAPMGPLAEIGAAGATSYGINALQAQMAQKYPGSVAEPGTNPMQSAITDMMLEGAFGGIPRGLSKLKSMGPVDQQIAAKASKFMKPNPAEALDTQDLQLLEGLGLDTTAGQKGGNSFIKSLERKFGGQAYDDILKRQERGLTGELQRIAGGDSSEVALQGVQKEWAGRLSESRAVQRSNFQSLMRHKEPIPLDLANKQAQVVQNKLKESSNLRKPLLTEAKSIIDAAAEPSPKGPPSMDAILELDERMQVFLADTGNSERDRRLVKSIADNLDKDVRGKLGANTSKWDAYQLARKEQSELFDGKEVGKILDSPFLEHSRIKKVLENPGSYADARAASKNVKQFDAAVKEQFLADIIEKSTNGTKFNLSQPLKELQSKKEAYNRFFNAAERNNIDQLMRTMERVSPEAVEKGTTSLSLAHRGGLYLGGGIIAGLLPGGMLGALGGAGGLALAGELSSRSFVKHILLDPTNSKIVAQLAKMPPNAPQARILTNHLFLGMKGAQIAFRQPEGGIIGWGTIGENGKLRPNPDGRER